MAEVKTIDTQQQEKAIDFIRDWCKWLIGLSFTSGVGCVTVLQQGVSSTIKIYLVGAILFFALSSIISVIEIALLPVIMQHLPLISKRTGRTKNVYEFKIFSGLVTIKTLSIIQLFLFAAGLVCLFTWVLLKPAK